MKYLILPAIAVSLALFSCGDSNETAQGDKAKETKNEQVTFDDIKLEDLKEPCECVDAIETVLDRLISTSGKLKQSEPDSAKKENAKKIFIQGQDKISEIGNRCQGDLGIPSSEIQNCDAYQQMVEKLQRVKQL